MAAGAEHRSHSSCEKSHSAAVLGSTAVRAHEMELIGSREPWNPPLSPNVYRIFLLLTVTLDDYGEGGIGFQKLGPWLLTWPFVDLENQHAVLAFVARDATQHVMQFGSMRF